MDIAFFIIQFARTYGTIVERGKTNVKLHAMFVVEKVIQMKII